MSEKKESLHFLTQKKICTYPSEYPRNLCYLYFNDFFFYQKSIGRPIGTNFKNKRCIGTLCLPQMTLLAQGSRSFCSVQPMCGAGPALIKLPSTGFSGEKFYRPVEIT